MKSKVCLIAGANSEFAFKIADKLSHEYFLILCRHKGHERSDRIVKIYKAIQYEANLTNENQTKNFMREVFQKYSHIDLLVNLTGKNIHLPDNNIDETAWDEVISANLKPAFSSVNITIGITGQIAKGA